MEKLMSIILVVAIIFAFVTALNRTSDSPENINLSGNTSETISNTISDTTSDEPDYYEMLSVSAVGDTVTFGAYEQDNNTSNGKETIEWIVLDKTDSAVLVISKYALDSLPYNTEYTDVTWETCTLRKWLNNDFMNNAFNTTEQRMILTTKVVAEDNEDYSVDAGDDTLDKMFLLSISEVEDYFASDESRKCQPTEYATTQGVYKRSEGDCMWWLRSPGETLTDVAYIYYGAINLYGNTITEADTGIRPAMWIYIN